MRMSFFNFILLVSVVNAIARCSTVVYPEDADAKRTFCQIVEHNGFGCERHTVTTDDGYILAMYRVTNASTKNGLGTVLFVHGVLGDATNFIINDPGTGLESNCTLNNERVSSNMGIAVAMAGYDTWYLQVRGNFDSQGHKSLQTSNPMYWRCSGDEVAKYDLPKVVDYILTVTSRGTLTYVGHSHGSTVLLKFLSSQTEYNNKINKAILLAPVTRACYSKSLLALLKIPPIPQILTALPGHTPDVTTMSSLFRVRGLSTILFRLIMDPIFGPIRHLNESRIQDYIAHLGVMPTWFFAEYLQHPCKCIPYFDYGMIENTKRYGQATPPLYKLSKISTKLILMIGDKDLTTNPKDTQCIRDQIKGTESIFFEDVSHLQGLISEDACRAVKEVLKQLAK